MPSNYRQVIKAFTKKASKAALEVAQEVAVDLTESLIIKTPVDTTRAEANWTAAINTAPQEFDAAKRNLGGNRQNLEKAKQLAKQLKLGNVFVVANSTPYIFRLEDGYSKQAPAGMRDLTAAQFQRIVERVLRRRRSGR